METCPACGTQVGEGVPACPACRLAVALFPSVREAAGSDDEKAPAYLRTVAELLASVDLSPPTEAGSTEGVVSAPSRFPSLPAADLEPLPTQRTAEPIGPLRDIPALPPMTSSETARRRIAEFFALGRRLGLDFTDFESRSRAAESAEDVASIEVLVREMFVHLTSALSEEYDLALARRNALADLVPTRAADLQFDAIRSAIRSGDLVGAQRRLSQVRDELGQAEDEWQVGRILVTECDLLVVTLRQLGGDPTPAVGPLEEGRRLLGAGHRAEGERVLAGAALAIWSLLEPRLIDELRQLRDQLVRARGGGADVAPAVSELRSLATELRQRNFAGTIVAYRHVREFVDRLAASPEGPAPGAASGSPSPDGTSGAPPR